jgi:hypothetical protein
VRLRMQQSAPLFRGKCCSGEQLLIGATAASTLAGGGWSEHPAASCSSSSKFNTSLRHSADQLPPSLPHCTPGPASYCAPGRSLPLEAHSSHPAAVARRHPRLATTPSPATQIRARAQSTRTAAGPVLTHRDRRPEGGATATLTSVRTRHSRTRRNGAALVQIGSNSNCLARRSRSSPPLTAFTSREEQEWTVRGA